MVKELSTLNEKEKMLRGLVDEIEEPSALTLLLVEQMADALYWARQQAIDKELIIYRGMQKAIGQAARDWSDPSFSELKAVLEQGIGSKAYNDFELKLNREVGLTIADLRARSMMDNMQLISQADDLIQRQVRNIRGLQKCIDSIDFKKRLVKKMDLELARLETEVAALPGIRDA